MLEKELLGKKLFSKADVKKYARCRQEYFQLLPKRMAKPPILVQMGATPAVILPRLNAEHDQIFIEITRH